MGEPGIDRFAAYRQAGVDLDISNVASQIAADYSRETWGNNGGSWHPKSPDEHLSASKRIPLDEIRKRPDLYGVAGVDGTGTKPEFYERKSNFYGLGQDLVAMAVDDIPVEGGEAVWMNNGLIISLLDGATLKHIPELFEGLRDGANKADVVLWSGETAVHGARLSGYGDFSVDWIGDAFGLVHESRTITGARVQEGDVLYGFAEPDGFRCNGISLVRKTFREAYGKMWHKADYLGADDLGTAVSAPSTIYAGIMNALTGGYRIEVDPKADIHGVAHISGGSLPEKIGRMLRASGLGADITHPLPVPNIMLHCQEVSEVAQDGMMRMMSDEELYSTWHGGQGYVVAAPEADHDAIVNTGEEQGVLVSPIGRIVKQRGIRVVSQALYSRGETLDLSEEG